jgi:cytidine deaminase
LVVSSLSEIPWGQLRALARAAAQRSYSPYSHLSVGAAGYTSDGRFVEGTNVENASYGLTLCAECSLVSDLVRQGGGHLVGVAVVAGDGAPLAPCGRCRQLLFEHGGPEMLVDAGEDAPATALATLLPGAFGPRDLGARRTE